MPAKHKEKPASSTAGRYLRKFTLQNARTFRSPVTLDFCHPDGAVAQWTVILGENGTGKTTLLQYLAGLSVVPSDREDHIAKSGQKRPPNIRPMFAAREWFGWCAANIPRPWSKPAEVTLEAEVSEAATSLIKANRESILPVDLKLRYGESDDGNPTVSANYTIHKDARIYSQLRLFAYGAGRHVAGPASPYLSSETFENSPTITIFRDDQPLISPEQWLLGLDHAARSEGETKKIASHALKSARRCLTATLPNVLDIKVRPYGMFKLQSAMTLMCKTPYGDVPFGSLSLGYRTMAAWLTDFVKRMHEAFPELEEPDDGPAVVLIDEFDLHMHPQWQREAMAAISREFPNTQFIVTAHSPIVVQATEGNAKLIVLRRKKRADGLEEVEVVDNPEFAAGWRLDQIMESVYGMTSRMPEFSKLVNRRIELLKKEKLTKVESKELKKIEEEVSATAAPQESEASKWLFEKLQEALKNSEPGK